MMHMRTYVSYHTILYEDRSKTFVGEGQTKGTHVYLLGNVPQALTHDVETVAFVAVLQDN